MAPRNPRVLHRRIALVLAAPLILMSLYTLATQEVPGAVRMLTLKPSAHWHGRAWRVNPSYVLDPSGHVMRIRRRVSLDESGLVGRTVVTIVPATRRSDSIFTARRFSCMARNNGCRVRREQFGTSEMACLVYHRHLHHGPGHVMISRCRVRGMGVEVRYVCARRGCNEIARLLPDVLSRVSSRHE
ncbi:MAG TPA: hypothetical protein VFW98_10705 [Gemmatimonadaceae bacterium]|nr:hypothetical protein [Gemmatimonadaceae bacterium]